MKLLTEYKRNGYTFGLLTRLGNYALFRGISKTCIHNFEVIEVQSHQGREIHGAFIEPAEFPPSNNQWGVKGWTFTDWESAEVKFKSFQPSLDVTAKITLKNLKP